MGFKPRDFGASYGTAHRAVILAEEQRMKAQRMGSKRRQRLERWERDSISRRQRIAELNISPSDFVFNGKHWGTVMTTDERGNITVRLPTGEVDWTPDFIIAVKKK